MRPPAGRSPTGWRSTSCVPPARTSTTSGSATTSSSAIRRSPTRSQQVGELIKNPKYVNAGLGDVATIASTEFNDVGTADPERRVHDVTAQAANFDSNYKSAKHRPGRRHQRVLLPADHRPTSATPSSVAAPSAAAFADRPEVQRVPVLPDHPGLREHPGAGRLAGSRPTWACRPRACRARCSRRRWTVLQDPDTVVPLRRLRPDAGRGRFGCRVEAVHRMDHRSGRCDNPGQHRCRLARQLTV